MANKFDPARWERLISPERRALLDPATFVTGLAITPGSTVADVGAGPGFFTDALAHAVGPDGRVYALDVSAEMVDILRGRDLPSHVDVMRSGENTLPLADGAADLVLLAFVLHELEAAPSFLREVRRVLRSHGRLVVLEWVPQQEPMGPPLAERIAAHDARHVLQSAGFAIADEGLANPSNYFVVATLTRAATERPDPAGAPDR